MGGQVYVTATPYNKEYYLARVFIKPHALLSLKFTLIGGHSESRVCDLGGIPAVNEIAGWGDMVSSLKSQAGRC